MTIILKLTRKQTAILYDISYLSMITGSDGVSFLFPQLFLSQHRLKWKKKRVIQKTVLFGLQVT